MPLALVHLARRHWALTGIGVLLVVAWALGRRRQQAAAAHEPGIVSSEVHDNPIVDGLAQIGAAVTGGRKPVAKPPEPDPLLGVLDTPGAGYVWNPVTHQYEFPDATAITSDTR